MPICGALEKKTYIFGKVEAHNFEVDPFGPTIGTVNQVIRKLRKV